MATAPRYLRLGQGGLVVVPEFMAGGVEVLLAAQAGVHLDQAIFPAEADGPVAAERSFPDFRLFGAHDATGWSTTGPLKA